MTQGSQQPYTRPPSNGLGIAGFIISLVAICSAGLLSPIGLLLSFIALFKRPRGFAFAGFVLGLIGTLFIAAIFSLFGLMAFSIVKYGKPMITTFTSIEQAHQKIDAYSLTHAGALPPDIEGNALIAGSDDGWGHPLHYTRTSQIGYEIRSASKDGLWGTEDDAVITYDARLTARP